MAGMEAAGGMTAAAAYDSCHAETKPVKGKALFSRGGPAGSINFCLPVR
jgi:hypothetical protein